MKITKLFEQKFLLGWGRHLWNVIGVSGFVAVLTGGVLFLNSTILEIPKTKNKYTEKLRTEVENLEKKLMDISYLDQNVKNRVLWAEKNERLYDKQRQLRNTEEGYDQYVRKIERKNDFKLRQRVISPFITGYGLAVIASASVSSALLSIERNTRKD